MKEIKILIFLLLISFASASPSLEFKKQTYMPQETIIGELKGTISEIDKNNLEIYENGREMQFEKDVVKYNETYYLYFIPTKEGKFTLKIKNL